MDFFSVYWAAFLAALSANLITVAVVYGLVLRHQGHSYGVALTKAGNAMLTVSVRAAQIYIGLLFLGGIAYAVKVLALG